MIDPELLKKYFEYSSPSDIYENLNKTIGLEVNVIKYKLAKLMEAIKRSPTSDAKKKLKTAITCWKLSNVFLSLIN